jgi:hypothetical protein
MGSAYLELDEDLQEFIAAQHVFFVGSAPLSPEGHVNVSPKGLDSFRILSPREVAYLDLTGSGVETVAHLRENGRLTVMFCAFSGRPRILRLYGGGRAVEPHDADWEQYMRHFDPHPGARSIVVLAVERIADSCGYGVPCYEHVAPRTQLDAWVRSKGVRGIAEYQSKHNRRSIDGLPGIRQNGETTG